MARGHGPRRPGRAPASLTIRLDVALLLDTLSACPEEAAVTMPAPAAPQVGDLTTCPDTQCGDVAEVVDVYELEGAGGSAVHVVTVCLWRHRYHQIT